MTDWHRPSLPKAFGHAFAGVAHAVRSQRNLRIHLLAAVVAIIASALLRLTALEWAIILIVIVLVVASELLNTAIEAIVDLISPDFHPLAKVAKDLGAAVVLIFALLAVVAGCLVFGNALFRLVA
jgi:diacylglycerol kinase